MLWAVHSRLRGRRTHKFKSHTSEGAKCEKGSEAPTTKPDRGPASEASVPSRIPGNGARSDGRFRWQVGRPRSQWGCSRPDALQFEPCDVGSSCCLAKDTQPSITRCSYSAGSRRRHQSHSSPRSSQLARSHQKAMCILANLSTLPKYLRSWQQFWKSTEAHAHSRKSSEWIRVWQRRRRNIPMFSKATDHATERPCPGAPHCAHPSRMLWVIITAHETRVREDLMTLPWESWSWQRLAKEHLPHHSGHFRTLRRVIVIVAEALDEGRIGGLERQHAMLCQIYGILESAAKDSGHDLTCDWLLTSIGHPPKPQQSSPNTGKHPHLSQQRNN